MGQRNAHVAICMEVSGHDFVWVDAYLACGYAASDDTPLLNVSG